MSPSPCQHTPSQAPGMCGPDRSTTLTLDLTPYPPASNPLGSSMSVAKWTLLPTQITSKLAQLTCSKALARQQRAMYPEIYVHMITNMWVTYQHVMSVTQCVQTATNEAATGGPACLDAKSSHTQITQKCMFNHSDEHLKPPLQTAARNSNHLTPCTLKRSGHHGTQLLLSSALCTNVGVKAKQVACRKRRKRSDARAVMFM